MVLLRGPVVDVIFKDISKNTSIISIQKGLFRSNPLHFLLQKQQPPEKSQNNTKLKQPFAEL